jgi:hypothetical protein
MLSSLRFDFDPKEHVIFAGLTHGLVLGDSIAASSARVKDFTCVVQFTLCDSISRHTILQSKIARSTDIPVRSSAFVPVLRATRRLLGECRTYKVFVTYSTPLINNLNAAAFPRANHSVVPLMR